MIILIIVHLTFYLVSDFYIVYSKILVLLPRAFRHNSKITKQLKQKDKFIMVIDIFYHSLFFTTPPSGKMSFFPC